MFDYTILLDMGCTGILIVAKCVQADWLRTDINVVPVMNDLLPDPWVGTMETMISCI